MMPGGDEPQNKGFNLPGGEPTADTSSVDAQTGTTTRRFAAASTSVGQARRFLLGQLPRAAARGGDADALVLMLSELATNAVQHAATDFEVTVHVAPDGRRVRVEVSDEAPGFPTPLNDVTDAPHGRGLHIVRALADAWGVDMRRDQPGKTVWFSSPLTTVDGDGTSGGPVREPVPARAQEPVAAPAPTPPPGPSAPAQPVGQPAWPVQGVRVVLDGLRDAVVATDDAGTIRYVNRAAEELLGWPPGGLVGRPVFDLVPDSLVAAVGDDYGAFVRSQASDLVGRPLDVDIKRADGTDVPTELVMSIFDHPIAGRVVVGIIRPRDETKLQRWSELTSELLEILADAPINEPPAERILSTLGRRLDWDVTTLWAVSADQDLVCRHVWTRTPAIAPAFALEKAVDPTSGSEGLPRWVLEHGEALWVADLVADERFVTDTLLQDGLQSAYAFPVRYHGALVGIVKMLSRHQRERDPSMVELTNAVGEHLGELLHASAQAIEREHLVEELLDARRHNEFLLLATQVLSEVVDYGEMVDRLARVSVPVMADLCLIDIVDEDGQMRRMAAWHADPEKRALTEELLASYPPDPGSVHPTSEVMRSGKSMWSADMDDEFLRTTTRDERHYSIVKMLGYTSYVTVPLRMRDEQVLGTVSLVSAGSGRRFSEKDLVLAERLAEQVSSVVIRARAYDRERRISHELQRHLLPDAIPAIRGWDVAARYRPAAVGVEVGGDWYDVIPLSEHLVALVVGDVEGHDLGAARIMSRLRHTLGLLLLEERAPGKALQRLNRVSLAGVEARLATALVGVLDTRTGSIVFSSAGHPSPVRIESGQAVELPVPAGLPLGVQPCAYKDQEFHLGRGCLVMFTDGLVEQRGSRLDDRFTLLESSLRTAPSTEPGRVADFIIDVMTSDARSSDDIVVLAARRRGDDPGLT
ncbi:MAG: SpoIIE family protein phosphatase [Acidimicrobiales bacterium]